MAQYLRTIIFLCGSLALLCACGGGGSDSGRSTTQSNSLPSAIISSSADTGYAPFALTFDGSQSSDSDGSITSYVWHMGDGNSYGTSQINHTFQTLGPFTVSLTVTDNDGATNQTSVVVDVYAQTAGYYVGALYSNVTQQYTDLEVIVGVNHEIHAWDYVSGRSAYWGNFNVVADRATGTLAAEIWDLMYTFPDSKTFGSVDIDAIVSARQDIIGTYAGVGDTGTIDIQYFAPVAERPSSLQEVSGTWTWSDGLGFTMTLIVSESGELDYSDTDGWFGRGQLFEMDPSLNAFRFQFDWTSPGWNGPDSGLAFVDDYYTLGTHWLGFAASWDATGDHEAGSDIWWVPRQAPVAAVSNTSNMKTESGTYRITGTKARRIPGKRR